MSETKIERRSFIKGAIGALLAPKVLGAEKLTREDLIKPQAAGKIILRQWHNRWWRAHGNLIQWTELGVELQGAMFLDQKDLVHWIVLPTMDICADMCIYRDGLIWAGQHGEIWRIEQDGKDPHLHYHFRLIDFCGSGQQWYRSRINEQGQVVTRMLSNEEVFSLGYNRVTG